MIRLARTEDLDRIREVERSAGEAFRQFGMDAIADDEPVSQEEFEAFVVTKGAFVAEYPHGHVAAYMLLEVVDEGCHIEQVSRHARVAGLGLGAVLLERAAEWAHERHFSHLSLTTFRDVPWNAAYYTRRGFEEFPEAEWGPQLFAKVGREADLGLAL